MKRAQLNLVLLVAAAGLGAVVYFSQEEEKKGAPLTALSADGINKIRIEHPGSPALQLEKQGSQWQLIEPVKALVDPIEINGVLSLATLERKRELNLSDVKPENLGLAPPAYSITLNDQKLEMGGEEPIEFRRYVLVNGTVALVDNPPSTALDADYSDLVSKQLIPEGAEIQSIALPGLDLSRTADGKWQLSPPQAGASADQMQKLADGWKNARSMWNAAETADSFKGDVVTVTLKDQSLRFIVAEREPQLVLVRPDLKVRYTLSKALEEELLKLPAEKKPEEAPKPGEGVVPEVKS